jgi:argininosuccinate lyase
MPQKKNPIVAEVVRAKSGKVFGNLTGALTLVKALCQSYALDLQELTPLLWDSLDETRDAVKVTTRMIGGIEPKAETMRQRSELGFSTATELADTLVRKGELSFRDAHAVVGRMVSNAIEAGKNMRQLGFEDLQKASEQVLGRKLNISPQDFSEALDPTRAVRKRELPGGPAPKAVSAQLRELRRKAKRCSKLLKTRGKTLKKAEEKLLKKAREFLK